MQVHMNVSNILNDIFNKLDKIIEHYSLRNKKIVIWGVSQASYTASQYLAESGCNVIGFVDNKKSLAGNISEKLKRVYDNFKELKVFIPDDILKNYSRDVMILVFSRYFKDILKQSALYGYSEEQCIWLYNSEDMVNTEDWNMLTPIYVGEQKQIEFDIMCYLKEICNHYGLRYYMSAGTLLGAVRHKGFIPWDDDIDIYMPWKDYAELIRLFATGEIRNERYSLMYHGICSDYSWVYAKLQDNRTISRGMRFPLICEIGVNIDIFPMGGVPWFKASAG